MLKRILLVISVLFFSLFSKATHIIGGYMHYEKISADTYKVTVTVYKDCKDYINGSGNVVTPMGFDNINGQPPNYANAPDAVLTVYYAPEGNDPNDMDSTGYYFTDFSVSDVLIDDPDSCRNVPADVCVQKGIYTIIVHLPDITEDGFYLSYQRCCRNPSSINVDVSASSTGIAVAAYIPKTTEFPDNSNPFFVNNPPIAFCLNNMAEYDLSAQDDDGDSLAYELTTPLDGANNSAGSGGPNSVVPPPYGIIDYNPGFSYSYPITSNPPYELDPVTGILSGKATQLGAFIVGYKVKEFRDSELISETIRDLRFYVLDCGENYASFDVEDHVCDGIETVDFISYSSDVYSFFWDFGIDSTNADSSIVEFPSYTYSENGQYTVTLLTNEGTECEDEKQHTFDFRNSIDVEIEQVSFQCLEGNSFDFTVLSYDFPVGTQLDWDFGPDASQQTGTGFDVYNVSYPDYGVYEVSLTATYNHCTTTSTIEVGIFPEIIVDIPDILIGCIDEEFTVRPNEIRPDYTYEWSIGGFPVSNQSTFDMSIDSITELDLELTVTDSYGCQRVFNKTDWLHIKNKGVANFFISDTVVYIGQPFDITNMASDYTSLEYDFGDGYTTTDEEPSYSYDEEGNYTISQAVDNGGDCPDYHFVNIDVRFDHYFYYPNVFTPNGDGLNDTFFPVRDGVKSYSLEIYDRWGQKVYNGTGQKAFHEWNGIYDSGEKGQQEVYNYFSTYVTDAENVYTVQGSVLLLK